MGVFFKLDSFLVFFFGNKVKFDDYCLWLGWFVDFVLLKEWILDEVFWFFKKVMDYLLFSEEVESSEDDEEEGEGGLLEGSRDIFGGCSDGDIDSVSIMVVYDVEEIIGI